MPFVQTYRLLAAKTISRLPLLSKLIILAASVLGPWISPSAAQAAPRQAPNSRVALELAPSFTASSRFSGFVDETSGASFVIVEMSPRTYEELKGMPDRTEALAQQGLTEVKRGELAGRTGEYVYFNGKQSNAAGEFAKFVLILRENGVTAMINANIPKKAIEAGTYTKEQIEQVLAGATIKDRPAQSAELFRFRYLGPFKEAFGLAGTSKAYSPSGISPAPGQNRMAVEPMLIVSPSIDGRPLTNPKATAEQSFRAFGGMKEAKIESGKAVEIGGLKGYQVIGEAAEAGTGNKLVLNLVLLSGQPDGYYAILGTVPISDRDKFMPELQKVIESFELVKP